MTARHAPAVTRTLASLKRSAPPTLSPEECVPWLGCSRSTIYELIRRGEFPARTVMVSGRVRVLTASLIKFLEDGETAG
jgi:excisionase family DNA binding protein